MADRTRFRNEVWWGIALYVLISLGLLGMSLFLGGMFTQRSFIPLNLYFVAKLTGVALLALAFLRHGKKGWACGLGIGLAVSLLAFPLVFVPSSGPNPSGYPTQDNPIWWSYASLIAVLIVLFRPSLSDIFASWILPLVLAVGVSVAGIILISEATDRNNPFLNFVARGTTFLGFLLFAVLSLTLLLASKCGR